jgi:hypothetical protein
MIDNEGGVEYAEEIRNESTGLAQSRPVFVNLANSATVTNVLTLTAYDVTYVVPANALVAGSVLHFKAVVRITADNLAETTLVEARLGGTRILTSSAVNAAAGDTIVIEGFVITRAVPGAVVDSVGGGSVVFSTGAAGTLATATTMADGVTFATNGALTLDFRVIYSAAGGNSSFLESLIVWIS